MSSLCGVGIRVRVNNFFSKTTRPRDMLFFLKDTLSIEDEKLFKACKSVFLLRKIALPYPHKCLFGFVEQNVSTDKNFLRNILVTRGDPFVCACPRLRSSRCRQVIVESSSLYFWSIWEQHVFSFIIVHLQTKIYEVLKRASVHLPVVVHYWTGTTTNSTSLVLKKVRIKMFYTRNLAVKSSAEDVIRLHSPSIRLELPACRGKGCKKSLL